MYTRGEVLSLDEMMSMQTLTRFHAVQTNREQTLLEHSVKVLFISNELARKILKPEEITPEFKLKLHDYALFHDVYESCEISGDLPSVSLAAKEAIRQAETSYWLSKGSYSEPEDQRIKAIVKLADIAEGYNHYLHNSRISTKQSKILSNWINILDKHLVVVKEVLGYNLTTDLKDYILSGMEVDNQYW